MWLSPARRPVYQGRSVVLRPDWPHHPPPPPLPVERYEERTYKASQVNDVSFSPFDTYGARPYPGTQPTRRTPMGKPDEVVALTPVPMVNPSVGHARVAADPYAAVNQYKPAGQLSMVWTDPESGQSKPVENWRDLRDYYLSVRGLVR